MPDKLLIEVMQDNLAAQRRKIAQAEDRMQYALTPEGADWAEHDLDQLERKESALSRRIVQLREAA